MFEDLSVMIDTSWKLGLIGRNGKGKTTLLRLLVEHDVRFREEVATKIVNL